MQLTHRNISSNYQSLKKAYDLNSDDIFLANLPYFHVFGQTANLWVPLCEGMTLVTYANPLDFKTISDIVREEKVTLMAGTPTFYWGYVRNSAPGDFDSIRIMISGADKCPEALRTAFLKKHAQDAARSLRHDRNQSGHHGQYAGPQPPRQYRPALGRRAGQGGEL